MPQDNELPALARAQHHQSVEGPSLTATDEPATHASAFVEGLHPPLLLIGLLCFCVGLATYMLGVLLGVPRYLFGLQESLTPVSHWLVWYSGVPIMLGIGLTLFDLLVLFHGKRRRTGLRCDALANRDLTVALTAYNDEASIGPSVRDFLAHPLVRRVIVVSNNSTDRTMEEAAAAGAIAINEPLQGYGRCVHRCLTEAAAFEDTDLVVLCEGDMTFRAFDIDKLIAFAPHADIVNGTRTVEVLRQPRTQLSTFMFYGNLFVGKLLEAKRLGRGTVTDVGTTYKLCRRSALHELLQELNPAINLEFNAHLLDTAMRRGLLLVECPITFHPRVGMSKGGNTDNWRAFKVGMRMIKGVVFGWERKAA